MVSGGMDAPGYYYAYPCKFHSINLVLELLLSQTYFNDNLQLNWLFKQFSTLTRNRNNYTSSLAKYGGLNTDSLYGGLTSMATTKYENRKLTYCMDY